MAELSSCAQLVRRNDNDRFLTALFAPADRREALFALYAFNIEVAKTWEATHEPLIGRMRLQWWRDALDGIAAGEPRRHEVVLPLGDAIRAYELSRGLMDRLIDARETDLAGEPPADLAALEAYAEETSATLVLLALEVLGVHDDASRAAGRHVGIAWALVGLLRALPFHLRRKRLMLPPALLAEAGARMEDVMELRSMPAISSAVRIVADRAREHLRTARGERPPPTRTALPALLSSVLADLYLARLARVGHDPFAPALAAVPTSRVWRLGVAALLRRY
jgi:phytoene synthase